MLKDQKEELIKLFVVAGKAHESAFADRDGEDEDWPLWYAEFLKEKMRNFRKLWIADKESIAA